MQKLITFLTLISIVMPASAVEVSRSKVDHPALGTAGGSTLHASIETIFTKLGDNANSRYAEFSTIADSTTVELDHNFGVNLTEMNVLIYTGSGTNLTRVTDPESQSPPWTIQEKTGSEKTHIEVITPSSGGPHTFAVIAIHGKGSEKLNDLSDVDVVTAAPEDGQALVYDAGNTEWIPGASGDASFKIQSVTDPNATIKGGKYALTNRRQLATYDGAGTASTDFFGDLTCDLDSLLGSSPSDDTTYSVFIDLTLVGNTPINTTDTGERLYPVECSDFVVLTTFPESTLGSRYVPVGDVHSADTGNVWSGTGASFSTQAFRLHDQTYVTVSPVVYSLAEQAVGSVGSSAQIVGGHVLRNDSFPSGILGANTSFWNLDDTSDDSDNSATLTNTGSTPFTGTDIFGSSGIALFSGTQALDTTDSLVALDINSDSFSLGGWFLVDDFTPTSDEFLFNLKHATNGNTVVIETDGDIGLQTEATRVVLSNPGFTDGTWHHYIVTSDTSNLKLYIDAELKLTLPVEAQVPTTQLVIAGFSTSANRLNGRAQDFFFTKTGVLNSEQIRKIMSYRIDHNQNVALADQNWVATFNGSLANQLDNGFIVDKSTDSLWFDFFDLASTDSVSLKLKNENASAHVLPLNTFDTGYLSSAPSFPLSHGLGSVPAQVVVIHEGQTTAGDFDDVSDKCSWDDTQITCSGLNTVDGTHRLRIVLSTSTVAVAVAEATTTDSGIVTTGSQTFGGNKTFANDVQVDSDVRINTSTQVGRLTVKQPAVGNDYFPGELSHVLGHSSGSAIFSSRSEGSGSPNLLLGTTDDDSGTTEIWRFDARNSSQTAITSRDLFAWTNANTKQMSMEADGDLFIQNQLGVGKTPEAKVHVYASDVAQAANGSSDIIIEKDGNPTLQFLAGDNGESQIFFGDDAAGSATTGRIIYRHDFNEFRFVVEDTTVGAWELNEFGLNTANPLDNFHLADTTPCMLFEDTDSSANRKIVRAGCGGEKFQLAGRNDTNTGDGTVGTFLSSDLSTGATELEVRTDGTCNSNVTDGNVCSGGDLSSINFTNEVGIGSCINEKIVSWSRNGDVVSLMVNADCAAPASHPTTIQVSVDLNNANLGSAQRTTNFSGENYVGGGVWDGGSSNCGNILWRCSTTNAATSIACIARTVSGCSTTGNRQTALHIQYKL